MSLGRNLLVHPPRDIHRGYYLCWLHYCQTARFRFCSAWCFYVLVLLMLAFLNDQFNSLCISVFKRQARVSIFIWDIGILVIGVGYYI
ncbi:hypothetical protein LZ32DRAFT_121645 [Colletotrichum eremochloae]|nr:hypothetical protein LZ32DRAFT_121645 [Colletotrichum eremochloae]